MNSMGAMKSRLQEVNMSFKSSTRITFVLVITSALFLTAFCFNIILSFIKGSDIILLDFPRKENDIILLFVLPVLLAPIFETFLNQYLPYYLLNKVKYLNERSYLVLLISALFFGLTHFYSLFYIIYAFLLGLILMYGYMIRITTDRKTFYLIAICHSLVNLGIFIRNLF